MTSSQFTNYVFALNKQGYEITSPREREKLFYFSQEVQQRLDAQTSAPFEAP